MRQILLPLVILAGLAQFFLAPAHAWSPLEYLDRSVEREANCDLRLISDSQGEESNEEEEEPDCE